MIGFRQPIQNERKIRNRERQISALFRKSEQPPRFFYYAPISGGNEGMHEHCDPKEPATDEISVRALDT
jgi:hypothetical protein